MRTELAISFAASLALNAGMLASFEHAVTAGSQAREAEVQRQKMMRAREDESALNFEFVESSNAHVQNVATSARRISDHDAVNQDQTLDKTLALSADGPRSDKDGRSDQLAQQQGAASSAAAVSSPSVEERPALTQQPEPSKENLEEKKKLPAEQGETGTEFVASKSETVSDAAPVEQKPAPRLLPSTPSPARIGSPASGRINTPQTFKTQSHGAQFYGVTSFEATGSGMGAYMKNLKDKIWMAWFPYLLTHYPKDFQTADAVVSITLNAQGDVKIVELVDSQGSPLFAAFCMESVQRAATFGPVPPEILALLGKDEFKIQFAFHYW